MAMRITDTVESRQQDMLFTALGPELFALMDDKTIIEIMLNEDGYVRIDRLGVGRIKTEIRIRPENALRAIQIIANFVHSVCDKDNPLLSAEFPGTGDRFEGLVPPVVTAPVFALRMKAGFVFSLDDYIEKGILTSHQKDELVKAVYDKKNILIAGGTGSGKTTLTNALLEVVSQTGDRVIMIQDMLELQCLADDYLSLRSNNSVTMDKLLGSTNRLRPDRIVVGEVRFGGPALSLLKAWNTGHPGGVATIHADSAIKALRRLENLILEVSVNPLRETIGEAVDIVVFMEKYKGSRRIREIIKVDSYDGQNYIIEQIA